MSKVAAKCNGPESLAQLIMIPTPRDPDAEHIQFKNSSPDNALPKL